MTFFIDFWSTWAPFWLQNEVKNQSKIDLEIDLNFGRSFEGPWRLLGGALLKNEAISCRKSGRLGVPGEGRVGVNPYPFG